MVTITITICLLITPFTIAFLHSSIIYNKHSASVYANYFIVGNISIMSLINSYAYLIYGDYISKFQGWPFSPAIFELGIFQLCLLILSVIAIFKGPQFKAACLIFFSFFIILNSINLAFNTTPNTEIKTLVCLGLLQGFISYFFYRKLVKTYKE